MKIICSFLVPKQYNLVTCTGKYRKIYKEIFLHFMQCLIPAVLPTIRSIANELPVSIQSLATCQPSEGEQLSLKEMNVLTYIRGYIVKKIADKVYTSCKSKIRSFISDSDPNHDFLAAKNYADAKVGLQVPSPILVDALKKMEVSYIKQIDDVMHRPRVKATLIASLVTCVDESLSCNVCKLANVIVHLMVNIRLHHSTRQANIKLRDKKDRKNRNVIKFSHL